MLLFAALNGCCVAQIPTQFIIANDSCEAFLPDYTLAVVVRDNCCVEQIVQTPDPGITLVPGVDRIVTLIGYDCYGNSNTMTFDVIVIDNVAPTFEIIDSTVLIPMGQFGTDERRWHFYAYVDSTTVDNYGNPDVDLFYTLDEK